MLCYYPAPDLKPVNRQFVLRIVQPIKAQFLRQTLTNVNTSMNGSAFRFSLSLSRPTEHTISIATGAPETK